MSDPTFSGDGEWKNAAAPRGGPPFPRFFNSSSAQVGSSIVVTGGSTSLPDNDAGISVVGQFDLNTLQWDASFSIRNPEDSNGQGDVLVRDRIGHVFSSTYPSVPAASGDAVDAGVEAPENTASVSSTLFLFSGELKDGRRTLADDLFLCDVSAEQPTWERVPKPANAVSSDQALAAEEKDQDATTAKGKGKAKKEDKDAEEDRAASVAYWPCARKFAACCAAGDHALFVHGGRGQDGSVLQDAWLFDLRTRLWQPLKAFDASGTRTTLPERAHHTASYCAGSELIVLFGGLDANGRAQPTVDTIHVPSGLHLPLNRLHGNAPGARLFHGAVIVDFPPEPIKKKNPFRPKGDPGDGPQTEPQISGNPKLVTVGGISGGGLGGAGSVSYILRLATQEWQELKVELLPGAVDPVPRHGALCHLIPDSKSVVLLGGYDGRQMVGDIDVMDLDTEAIRARRAAEAEAKANANFGKSTYPNGDVYEGFWQGNNRHGEGKCTYANGDVYEGNWADDNRSGRGKCKFANGDEYDGSWRNDKRHGIGKQTYAAGGPFQRGDASYSGKWADDVRCGSGAATFRDGSSYEGEWSKDMRNGQGSKRYRGGATYTGQWLDDDRSGRGFYALPDGAEFTGDFLLDKYHGQGTMILKDGTTYNGAWRSGFRNGHGTCKYGNRDYYEGKWLRDLRSGQGVCKYADGSEYAGIWVKGERHGTGRMQFTDGSVYEGEWRHDFCAGQGVLRGTTRGLTWVYDGTFKGGHQHSDEGECTYTVETVDETSQEVVVQPYGEYKGGWRKGKREGHGVMRVVAPDSSETGTYDGEWHQGYRSGSGVHSRDDGFKYEGGFVKDLYQNDGIAQWPASAGFPEPGSGQHLVSFSGSWLEAKPHGEGTARFANGDEYTGSWWDGQRSGKGICRYANGDQYDGEWEDGLRHGKGTTTLANGSQMTNTFVRGTVG